MDREMEEEEKREMILRQALSEQHLLTCYAYSLLQDWSLAKDAFQEMLISATSKADSFKEGNMAGWLRVILKRKALDMLKARKAEVHFADEELFSLVDSQLDPMFDEERREKYNEQRKILHECMKELRSETLDILVSFYRDRISCDRLAEKLGKTVNSIWLTLSRSRKVLRKCAFDKLSEEKLYDIYLQRWILMIARS
jgi:RNA polymerase sigma factor (sigma-70 family)